MKAAFYDDKEFSYLEYWDKRQYEHGVEELAITKLLRGKFFSAAADIGGGFGRLTPLIAKYAQKTTLIEPAPKMRQLAKIQLKNYPDIKISAGDMQQTGQAGNSLDLACAIRVLHHIPDLQPVFAEMARVVKPGGFLLIEFANSLNAKSQVRSFLEGKPILPTPLERRSLLHIKQKTIDFVNHHPDTVLRQLQGAHFAVRRVLSVSNFRAAIFKKFFL